MNESSPVNPDATPEARELLAFLYDVMGRKTLSGQHNQMHHMSVVSEHVQQMTGEYPLIWGGEWGFSDERHNIDNVKYRPRLMEQIREQHAAGRIIALTYHQASPTIGEPCDFRGGVQLNLSPSEWDEVLTPGTRLHSVWEQHVDRLAEAIDLLGRDRIPVLFRPYHEMNGEWFWWGGDSARFKALWHMVFDRFVHRHRLNNLLWAWNPDAPHAGVEEYYPRPETVDVVGTDIYPSADRATTYPQEWYERMKLIADGKPLALSEMSILPTDDELERQPWVYFMAWDDMLFRANDDERIRQAYASQRILSRR